MQARLAVGGRAEGQPEVDGIAVWQRGKHIPALQMNLAGEPAPNLRGIAGLKLEVFLDRRADAVINGYRQVAFDLHLHLFNAVGDRVHPELNRLVLIRGERAGQRFRNGLWRRNVCCR